MRRLRIHHDISYTFWWLRSNQSDNQGSDDIPVYITSAPGFETWNSSRDLSETNLAWVEILAMVQFCAIDHALFWRFCDFKIKITPLLIGIRTSAWL